MPEKIPPHIHAQLEEFKRKATHNQALSKEYNDYYNRTYVKDQPTYEQWLKMKGYEKMAKGGKANLEKFLSDSKIHERVYHATPENFNEFKPGGNNSRMSGKAIWTSTDPKRQPASHNIHTRGGKYKQGVNVMPLHVKAKNPLMLDDPTMIDWAQKVFAGGSREFPELLHPHHIDEVRKEGYDSIILADPHKRGDPHEVIVFEPHQLKSATGNRGTYDPNDPDITKAKGGVISLLRKHGQPVNSHIDAMKRQSNGHHVYAFHEQDETPREIKSMHELQGYTPEQIYTLHPQHLVEHKAKGGSPSIKEMQDYIANQGGGYEGRRFERASDEIPHLMETYDPEALKTLFRGDNAKALMTMNPADFEKYATPIHERFVTGHRYATEEGELPMLSHEEYIKHLANTKRFKDIPFLEINKEHQGRKELPFISGHEGRHRNRALSAKGLKTGLVQLLPRAELREPFPRRQREDYINALRNELSLMDNKIRPEKIKDEQSRYGEAKRRSIMQLPDIYAEGGDVQGQPMNTPTLAQMRHSINMHGNPDIMDNIGINEAMDMSPKIFVNPDPQDQGIPSVGGVADRGGLPIGGVDTDVMQPGQQLNPQPPAQPQAGQPPQGGQPPQAGQPPQGPTPPQGNMLSLTPQGQTMQAMQPQSQPPQMASGGAMRVALANYMAKGGQPKSKIYQETDNPKRVLVKASGAGNVNGIVVPKHMIEGNSWVDKKSGKKRKIAGLRDISKARAEVYGSENRPPLTLGQVANIHKKTLEEHFKLPMEEQNAQEIAALERLRKAQHIGEGANTLDKSEKLDTVHHELGPNGRPYIGFASKGVAGHALYTSGHGSNQKFHVINTCPGQTVGCGGGVDKNGHVDTSKGTCFAPNAESQYAAASVRRASHEQAKHDPAMTNDFILAHTGSLRHAASLADKHNVNLLFRPNVVDETDVSSRHAIRHLNEQRRAEGLPDIIANSYGKTNELHDPENGYYVTHSNVGPKTKHGHSISENIGRDKARVRNTILAADNRGDFVNEQGHPTPPKNSYMVTNVKRGSDFDKKMQQMITHAKYWSAPRNFDELSEEEKAEGNQSHYNGKGELTTPNKAHYGHILMNNRRYDYQKQHILHPRLVQVGHNEDGTPHMIPTDSRFKDDEELEKTIPRSKQFKTRNGKRAGLILMTTPTESTSNLGHHTEFTHNVDENHLEHAKRNNGEYEIDNPMQQEISMGREYIKPEPIQVLKKKPVKLASGGSVTGDNDLNDDDFNAFPERNFASQFHLAKRLGIEDIKDLPKEYAHKRLRNG